MERYTKRPPEYEAVQLNTQSRKSLEEVLRFFNSRLSEKDYYNFAYENWGKDMVSIGECLIEDGDFVVLEDGKFKIIRERVFDKKYIKAD